MASSLVERLMGDPFCPPNDKIPVHSFFAAQVEIIAGRLTKAQVKTYLAMDADTQAEYDTLAAMAPATTADRVLWLEGIHSLFILAEDKVPGYDTPAGVRSKLGL